MFQEINLEVYHASKRIQAHSVVPRTETAFVCTSRAKELQVEPEMPNSDEISSTDLAGPQDWCLHCGTRLAGV